MSIANLHQLAVSYLDDTQLLSLIEVVEGDVPKPYADTKGIATIVLGINITIDANLAFVLNELGVFSSYIDQVNAARSAAGLPALTEAESQLIYTDIVNDFSQTIDSISIVGGDAIHGNYSDSEVQLQNVLKEKGTDLFLDRNR